MSFLWPDMYWDHRNVYCYTGNKANHDSILTTFAELLSF